MEISDPPVLHTVTPLRKRSSSSRAAELVSNSYDSAELRRSVSEEQARRGDSPLPLRKSRSSITRALDTLGSEPVQFVEPSLWATLSSLPGALPGTDALGSFVRITAAHGELKIYSR